jgi:hypothetical protein
MIFISKGASTTATFRHMTVAPRRISLDEPLQREVSGMYASTSHSLFNNLGKSEVGKVDFEDFKMGLEAINCSCWSIERNRYLMLVMCSVWAYSVLTMSR